MMVMQIVSCAQCFDLITVGGGREKSYKTLLWEMLLMVNKIPAALTVIGRQPRLLLRIRTITNGCLYK